MTCQPIAPMVPTATTGNPRTWLAVANRLAPKDPQGHALLKIYSAGLLWVATHDYRGGCHLLSAALHVLLLEAGLKAELCLGEVRLGTRHMDHSWVEVRARIFDFTVFSPLDERYPANPVFDSIDLGTGAPTTLVYGEASTVGYDVEANNVVQQSLGDYSAGIPDPRLKIWQLAKTIGKEARMRVNAGKLERLYGDLHRTNRTPQSMQGLP